MYQNPERPIKANKVGTAKQLLPIIRKEVKEELDRLLSKYKNLGVTREMLLANDYQGNKKRIDLNLDCKELWALIGTFRFLNCPAIQKTSIQYTIAGHPFSPWDIKHGNTYIEIKNRHKASIKEEWHKDKHNSLVKIKDIKKIVYVTTYNDGRIAFWNIPLDLKPKDFNPESRKYESEGNNNYYKDKPLFHLNEDIHLKSIHLWK